MNALRFAAKAAFAASDLVLPRLAGPRILIYHQVGSGSTHQMNVATEVFTSQLDWLRSNGEIVRLEEAVARRGEPDSDRLYVVTFDDGYADVFENAFPFMLHRGIPFTLYLTSGPIENRAAFPAWPGVPLTWAQISSMMGTGLVSIGAHTHTHPDLRELSVKSINRELDLSNQLISDRVGASPVHFTYPKGWWAHQAHEPIKARYQTATLGTSGSITGESDPYLLHRVPVQSSDLGPLVRSKIRTGGRSEDFVRRRIRRYHGP